MRLLRSALSDPISVGINSFRSISDVLNQQESLKMRRSLMEREAAESQVRMEREKQGIEAEKENIGWNKQMRSRMGMEWAREDDLRNFNAAVSKLDSGQNLEVSDYDSILKAAHGMPNWKDLKPEQWSEVHNNLRSLKTGIDHIWPQIAEVWGKGQGVYINRSQAPELFSAFDKIPSYGGAVNRGKDRHGETEGVEKSLERIYFDPRNGTMTPLLRVKDSKGDTYEAPMTADRGNDPNAPVLQLPVQIFNAHLNAQLKMADWADSVRMKLGDKEVAKRHEAQKETLKQNEVWLAGEDSVEELLTKNPNATANELRNAFKKSVREKAKEKGIAIAEKDITNEAAKISERLPSAGVQEFREYQQMDARERAAFETFTKLKHPQAQGKDPMAAFNEWKKLSPSEKKQFGEFQRVLKPREPKEPKISIQTTAEGDLVRVPVQGGPATPVVGTSGQPLKKKPELSAADLKLIGTKKDSIREMVEGDHDVSSDKDDTVIEYAGNLVEKNPKLTSKQAIAQAKKELGIEKKWTEEELRKSLKEHGKSSREVDDYIKRAKTAGKL
jgi:hypothetical protein